MKKIIVTLTALVMTMSVMAQSLEDGIKMYNYQKYQSAKKILQPLAASNALANYYLGLSELAIGNTKEAGMLFAKYPEDFANISGTVRIKFISAGENEGMTAARALADMGKRKDYMQKKYAADAVTYSSGGDKQQAIDWYKEVMEKLVNTEVLIATGDAYQQIRSGGGEAMNHYEDAVEKDPNSSLAFSRIGKLWYNAKNYELALENWEKAKKADPENPIPYRDLADAYTYVGKYKQAKENLEEYMQHSDKSDDDMVRYAEIQFLAKEHDKAIETIQGLMGKGIVKPNFYGILGYSYLEKKDSVSHAKALENIRVYFAKQEPNKIYSLDYMNQGRAYLKNGFGDSANTAFNKALSMDSTDNKISIYRDIAESYRKELDWVNAGNWYEKTYIDFPEKATAQDYWYSGYSYFVGSNSFKDDSVKFDQMLQHADTLYGTMMAKYPDQPSGYYWRGRVNFMLDSKGENCAARPYFEKWLGMEMEGATKSDKDKMIAYQYLALCYYNQSDCETSKEYCDKIFAINEDNALAKQLVELCESQK